MYIVFIKIYISLNTLAAAFFTGFICLMSLPFRSQQVNFVTVGVFSIFRPSLCGFLPILFVSGGQKSIYKCASN